MIAPLEKTPRPVGTVVGAKIETLYRCYSDVPALASFFEHEGGALLALFSGRLTVSGKIPADELISFADFVGAREIEGLSTDISETEGFVRTLHLVMACKTAVNGCEISRTQDPMEGYDILAAADKAFADESDRWEWLSDVVRRTNRDCGGVYVKNGAVAVVTAKSGDELLIGAVASHPDARKTGAASSLVRSVCEKARSEGLLPVTVAVDDDTSHFYERLGFEKTDTLALLTRK